LSITISKNKKGSAFSKGDDDFHRASSLNPLFQQKLFFIGCPYCSDKVGRKKNFKTLWKIFLHVQFQHKNEKENFKSVIWNLSDYVLRGILR